MTKVPPFPLPVVRVPIRVRNPDRVRDPNRNYALSEFEDTYQIVIEVDAEVLMLNISAGTMRVRSKDHGTHELPAFYFFDQHVISRRK